MNRGSLENPAIRKKKLDRRVSFLDAYGVMFLVSNANQEENRLCLLCDLVESENEDHLFVCCSVYEDVRDTYQTVLNYC